jgi:hypothetical protein
MSNVHHKIKWLASKPVLFGFGLDHKNNASNIIELLTPKTLNLERGGNLGFS